MEYLITICCIKNKQIERKEMKKFLLISLLLALLAGNTYGRRIASIQVHEWGVLTWNNNDPVLSSVPGTDPPFVEPVDQGGMIMRAPVLYFHGPEFTGTVTVKTDNGSIFDIYPVLPDMVREDNMVSWTAKFKYAEIEEYPNFHGMVPGEWNYNLWRVDSPLSIFAADGWNDKFLYYETAPVTTSFLPYTTGQETLCEEYENIEVIIIKPDGENSFFMRCYLSDLVEGKGADTYPVTSDAIVGILYEWSAELLEFEETDALWATWSDWMSEGYKDESTYADGFVLYMIPEELTNNFSEISVETLSPSYPVNTSRFLLVAMPL